MPAGAICFQLVQQAACREDAKLRASALEAFPQAERAAPAQSLRVAVSFNASHARGCSNRRGYDALIVRGFWDGGQGHVSGMRVCSEVARPLL